MLCVAPFGAYIRGASVCPPQPKSPHIMCVCAGGGAAFAICVCAFYARAVSLCVGKCSCPLRGSWKTPADATLMVRTFIVCVFSARFAIGLAGLRCCGIGICLCFGLVGLFLSVFVRRRTPPLAARALAGLFSLDAAAAVRAKPITTWNAISSSATRQSSPFCLR